MEHAVGGAAFGGDAQSLTTSAANYTFTGSASGEIVVRVAKPSKAAKALYVKSVAVTYESSVPITSISMASTASIEIGGTTTLTPTVLPANTTETVTWESSDTDIATVSAGVVTGVAAGTATITAKSPSDATIKAECEVTVNAATKVATPAISVATGTYNEEQSVTLSCLTDGATIRYTTDGTDPTAGSTAYSSAITVDRSMTLKAKAFKGGLTDSEIASATYTLKCVAPTITVPSGVFVSSKVVTITSSAGTSIYYTTDGSTPTTGSTPYDPSDKPSISATTTIKAIAAKDGWSDSDEASETFTKETVLDGISALNSATTSSATARYVNLTDAQVTWTGTGNIGYLNDASAGIYIYGVSMTLNTKYNGVWRITTKTYNNMPEITAFAEVTGEGTSEVASAMAPTVMTPSALDDAFTANLGRQIQINAFTVPDGKALTENITLFGTSPYTDVTVGETYNLVGYPYINKTTKTFRVVSATLKPQAPTFDPVEGEFSSDFTLHLASATDGATIYYTTDGTTPTELSTEYDDGDGISISGTSSVTVKAIAVKSGASSDVSSATYTYKAIAMPLFGIASGTAVYYGTKVEVTCATDDADLYYTLTTNGTTPADPTDASTAYPDGGIAITANTVNIKVIAKKGSDYSSVASATYTLQEPAEPTFSPAAGAVARGTVVTISSAAGTSIVYTTDGSDADTGTEVETNSVNVTIDDAMTIKAIAYDPELNMSSEASAAYTIAQVATPTFSVAAGAVAKGTTVELACVTEGATIHYTRDGSTPTASSPAYSSAITLNYGQTIKAIAVKTNYDDSEVASATYTITGGSETLDLTTLSDGTKPSTINGTDVSYTFSVGTGSNAPQYYSSGSALRFYQYNTLTIASATKTISSIAIHFTQNSQNMSLVAEQPGTLGSGSGVGTRTWTGNASSVQFTTDPACRFDYITVTYASVDDRTPCVTSLDLATKSFPKDNDGTLTATATENGSLTGDVTYTFSSNDAEVLGVEEDGTYAAYTIGTAKVTVTASPAAADLDLFKPVVAEVDVKVTGTTTMTLSATEDIEEFDTPITFTVTELAEGYDGVITVSSGTPSVATASIEGNIVTVTPVKVGTTVITVTAPATDLYLGTVNREFTAYFDQPAGKTTAPSGNVVLADMNFATNDWSLPTSYTTTTDTYSNGDYSVTIAGEYAFNSSYTMLKSGSSLTFQTFDKPVTKIDVVGNSGASGSTKENIYVGETAVSTERTGSKGTNSFEINSSYQAVGTTYILRVSAANAQITRIKVYTAPDFSKTLNAYGYATYCCEYPLDFTDAESNGYSAWQVTDVSDGVITFAQITGKVKGGTPVLLKGTANATINMTACDSENNISGTNKLKGTLAETYLTQVDGSYINFGLSGNQFKKVADGTVVPAGKAYLPVLTSEISGAKAFTFLFEEDDADGISEIENGKLKVQDEEAIYNLAGQRISRMQKGINIVNGKKVLY